MDETRFDASPRGLATGTSRRRIFTGVLGAMAGVLAGGALVAAKPGGNGKRHKGVNGKGKGKNKTKVTLCHNSGTPQKQTIVVGEPAAATHRAHGDVDGACLPLA